MTDDIDAWLDANAALLGIPVQPEWREGIRLHLRITRDLARRVMEFPLSDEADPAPIFRA
jgi:1-carboxybiuret hydrolase subunit AtzG-like protein